MIEKHYSHLIARLRGADLAGDDYGDYDGVEISIGVNI